MQIIECPNAECAEGYEFKPAPHCGCFKPEDLPKDSTADFNPIPFLARLLPPYFQQTLQPIQQLPPTAVARPQIVVPVAQPIHQLPIVAVRPSPVQPLISDHLTNCEGRKPQCLPQQRLNEITCRCDCVQQEQCQFSFQVFNPATCRCEPNECPNRCSQCETQNSVTCGCEPIQSCPPGKTIDTQTCQCFCSNGLQCNNRLQRLNPNTCQCECKAFITTIEQVIQRPLRRNNELITSRPIHNSARLRNEGRQHSSTHTRHRGRGRQRHRHRGGRQRGKRQAGAFEDEAEIPTVDEFDGNKLILLRQKRVKQSGSRTRSGKRSNSRSNSRRNSRSNSRSASTQQQQEQRIVLTTLGQQALQAIPITITTTKEVLACPLGKFPISSTCTCSN